MLGISKGEVKILDFLLRNFTKRYSINKLAQAVEMSPMGTHYALNNLKKLKTIKPEPIGNAIYYRVNLDEELGRKAAEFSLAQHDLNSYAKIYAKDFESLKDISYACVLFGSVLTKGKEARDVDVLLIIEKKNFKKVYNSLKEMREIRTKKIHDILMVKGDLAKNIAKGNEAMIDLLKKGKILWGSDIIVGEIQNGASGK